MNLYSKHTNPESLYGYKDRFKIPSVAYKEAEQTGNWEEAEPYIMKSPKWAYWYAMYVIKGRWPEAEPVIMQDPESAFYYAVWVIGDRWPEAELVIMKDPDYAYEYKKFIGSL